jgi:hypothetical protein
MPFPHDLTPRPGFATVLSSTKLSLEGLWMKTLHVSWFSQISTDKFLSNTQIKATDMFSFHHSPFTVISPQVHSKNVHCNRQNKNNPKYNRDSEYLRFSSMEGKVPAFRVEGHEFKTGWFFSSRKYSSRCFEYEIHQATILVLFAGPSYSLLKRE